MENNVDDKDPQRGWDGGPILLIFLVSLVAIFLAALEYFTGGLDPSLLSAIR